MRSPGSACVAARTPTFSSSERWRAKGPSSDAGLSVTRNQARPTAPARLACSVRSSSRERGKSAPPATRSAFTVGEENAFTSVPSKTSDSSTSSMPKRRSGLSVP